MECYCVWSIACHLYGNVFSLSAERLVLGTVSPDARRLMFAQNLAHLGKAIDQDLLYFMKRVMQLL
jgi:hypothetical protein